MAMNRKLFRPLTAQPGLVCVTGRVAIGGTGAVGTATGKGFVVTRTNTGLYTITLDSTGGVPNILSAWVDVGFGTGSAQLMAKVLTIVPASKLVTVQTSTVAAPNTAADPTTASFLQFQIWVQNTSSVG